LTKPDHLVHQAEKLGLKLFVLISSIRAGLVYERWKAVNDRGSNSVVLNYEHPEVRRAYTNIAHVTGHSEPIRPSGLDFGNEYAYFDLWNQPGITLHDTNYSIPEFQAVSLRIYRNISP
jgi:hypothetical protein